MKPKRYKPEFAVQAWVEAESRRFRFPDLDTLPVAGVSGGAGGAPTVGVAAVDASTFSTEKAEYHCTGTNDEVIIMEAMGDLYVAGGGRLWLSEGTFTCVSDVIVVGYSIPYPVPMMMMGMGWSTRFDFLTSPTNFDFYVTEDSELRDIQYGTAGGGG
jgi:hypothetical protein